MTSAPKPGSGRSDAAMEAMMALVEPMIPAMRRYARAILKDRFLADDLVQDALERIITRWHQRDAGGNARAWVFAILHNLALNRLRRAGGDLPIDVVEDRLPADPAMQEDGLLHADLLAALHTLPEEQRSVVLLVSVEDLSYAEAAAALGVPVGTVMSRLSRGRARLMRLMDGESGSAAEASRLRRVK